MTYENFKYEVRKLGLNFYVLNDLISVQDDKRNALYSVDTTKPYIIYHTKRFSELDDTTQEKLFYLIILLARTSINDRGDLHKETKWYLKHKYLNTWGDGNYLIKGGGTAGLFLGYNTGNVLTKCKFTKYEIEELGKIINLNDFEWEKVE